MPNTELKVVDMPMGTGKTTGMIHPYEHFFLIGNICLLRPIKQSANAYKQNVLPWIFTYPRMNAAG